MQARFRAEGTPVGGIYELQAKAWFRADMAWTWLRPGSMAEMFEYAQQYWSGRPHPDGCTWEYLLSPPVRVLRRVDLELQTCPRLNPFPIGTSGSERAGHFLQYFHCVSLSNIHGKLHQVRRYVRLRQRRG